MSDSTKSGVSRADAEAAVRTLIEWVGDDPDRQGVRRTPARVIDAFGDWYAGYQMDPDALLGDSFQPVKDYDRIVTLLDIDFASHCEHHMAPFIGRVHLAYLPDERLAGISKLVRVVEAFTRRMQVQERLTAEIAQCIDRALKPRGVAVIVDAQHQCMTTRGVNKTRIRMVTDEMLGAFRDDDRIRAEFLHAVGNTRRAVDTP